MFLKNITSEGAVELKRLKVTLKNEILKVTKSFMIVMKSVRDMNLYYLKGSIITSALTALMDSDEDAIMLLHMRLGHAG